jgi:hypothetical protein
MTGHKVVITEEKLNIKGPDKTPCSQVGAHAITDSPHKAFHLRSRRRRPSAFADSLVVERASLARPTSSGWQHRPWATADKLSPNPGMPVM